MNSKILRLDAPYQVIYAGGKVGRHIATLISWADDADAQGEVIGAHQYPIIDEGNEMPAGTLVETELEDCRVICPINEKTGKPGTNLYWFADIIEYDFQQLEPAGITYIGERMKMLDCSVKFPDSRDEKRDDGIPMPQMEFDVDLSVFSPQGSWEENREFRVKGNKHSGFYFEAYGTAEEVYNQLSYQRSEYFGLFHDDLISIKFHTYDADMEDVLDRLNEHCDGY